MVPLSPLGADGTGSRPGPVPPIPRRDRSAFASILASKTAPAGGLEGAARSLGVDALRLREALEGALKPLGVGVEALEQALGGGGAAEQALASARRSLDAGRLATSVMDALDYRQASRRGGRGASPFDFLTASWGAWPFGGPDEILLAGGQGRIRA